MPSDILLTGGDWDAVIRPQLGGSVARLDWQGEAIFRRAEGPGVLDMGCFPLVPFSNRIAGSRFVFAGREITLAPNHPLGGRDPVLHGFGWTAPWQVAHAASDRARIELVHRPGEWPWGFAAWQEITLGETARLVLGLTNLSAEPMPAGLGFHPYFPRTAQTRYCGRHRGEWQVDAAVLPVALDQRGEARDWWAGAPVASRIVDTAYTGREGPLIVAWPERGLELSITPSDDLTTTVVYVPEGEDFFCAEPVSHATDAINRGAMRVLEPGESWSVALELAVRKTG